MRQILKKKIKKETAEIAERWGGYIWIQNCIDEITNRRTEMNFCFISGEDTRAGKFEEWQHPRHFRLNFPTSSLKTAIPPRPQNSIATRKLGWYYKARWKGEKSAAVGVYIRCANVVTCCVILEILWIWYSCGWARLTFNEKSIGKEDENTGGIFLKIRLFIISRGNRVYIYVKNRAVFGLKIEGFTFIDVKDRTRYEKVKSRMA